MAQVTRALVVEALCASVRDTLAAARSTPWRGTGTPRGRASSPAGWRGVFLLMLREDTMTARKPAKPSRRKKISKRRNSEQPENGWPAVVRYALEDWPRTVRLCVVGLVFGLLVLLAMRLSLQFWPWLSASLEDALRNLSQSAFQQVMTVSWSRGDALLRDQQPRHDR